MGLQNDKVHRFNEPRHNTTHGSQSGRLQRVMSNHMPLDHRRQGAARGALEDGGTVSSQHACRGEFRVWWTNSSTCAEMGVGGCASGDHSLALQDTAIARCGPSGNSFRYFNRTTTNACLERLARGRSHSYHNASNSYRLLMMGVSSMRLVWHAMSADDAYPDILHEDRSCGWGRLNSFAPHVIEYGPWLVVANTSEVFHKTHPKCISQRAIYDGAGAVRYAVQQASEPYDAVAINAGAWDASYTRRDEARFEAGLDAAVRHLQEAWPAVRVILFTPTPCGPAQLYPHHYESRNQSSPKAAATRMKEATPAPGCLFVVNMTRAVRRVASRYPSTAEVLDAHQMVQSHPANRFSGPPGIWPMQLRGWHLSSYASRRERERLRIPVATNAVGEMNRALANRLYNVLCTAPRRRYQANG